MKTPLIYDKALWETSGHWEKFRENMFLDPGRRGARSSALKPMNCPGHMLLFGSQLRSYRDLPVRYAEAGPLHRNELAGALHGLTRVRHVTQDDAHIFCTREQIEEEIDGASTSCVPLRPVRDRAAGRALDAARQQARHRRGVGLHGRQAGRGGLSRYEIEYYVGEGEGSFYGPKIDLHTTDSLGRSWQLGTIQLDAQMPRASGSRTWARTT